MAYLEQMKQTIWVPGQLTEQDVTPHAQAELLQIFRDWQKK